MGNSLYIDPERKTVDLDDDEGPQPLGRGQDPVDWFRSNQDFQDRNVVYPDKYQSPAEALEAFTPGKSRLPPLAELASRIHDESDPAADIDYDDGREIPKGGAHFGTLDFGRDLSQLSSIALPGGPTQAQLPPMRPQFKVTRNPQDESDSPEASTVKPQDPRISALSSFSLGDPDELAQLQQEARNKQRIANMGRAANDAWDAFRTRPGGDGFYDSLDQQIQAPVKNYLDRANLARQAFSAQTLAGQRMASANLSGVKATGMQEDQLYKLYQRDPTTAQNKVAQMVLAREFPELANTPGLENMTLDTVTKMAPFLRSSIDREMTAMRIGAEMDRNRVIDADNRRKAAEFTRRVGGDVIPGFVSDNPAQQPVGKDAEAGRNMRMAHMAIDQVYNDLEGISDKDTFDRMAPELRQRVQALQAWIPILAKEDYGNLTRGHQDLAQAQVGDLNSLLGAFQPERVHGAAAGWRAGRDYFEQAWAQQHGGHWDQNGTTNTGDWEPYMVQAGKMMNGIEPPPRGMTGVPHAQAGVDSSNGGYGQRQDLRNASNRPESPVKTDQPVNPPGRIDPVDPGFVIGNVDGKLVKVSKDGNILGPANPDEVESYKGYLKLLKMKGGR